MDRKLRASGLYNPKFTANSRHLAVSYARREHRVLPSSTLEFDGQFNGGGETIFTEINLNEDHTIDDMFCTCGAGSLCVHLAAMMYDMVERDTIRLSELENESENR